jgi:transcriptional regulator with XRE-family HTH domain
VQPDRSSLGRAIRRRREQLSLSQEALAERAGVHRTYVGGVERGERNITVVTLAKFANALKTQASTILEDAEELRSSPRE